MTSGTLVPKRTPSSRVHFLGSPESRTLPKSVRGACDPKPRVPST